MWRDRCMSVPARRAIFVLLLGCFIGCASSSADEWGSRVELWEKHAPYCIDPATQLRYPSKADCEDGDMTLFNGLLCAAGDDRGCKGVGDAQGSSGEWLRSPR